MTSPKLDDLRAFANEAHARILSFVPTKIGDHLTAAKKEILSAVKVAIDEEMKWTDRRWENAKDMKDKRAETPEPAQTDPTDK
jgi:hypothetical protein